MAKDAGDVEESYFGTRPRTLPPDGSAPIERERPNSTPRRRSRVDAGGGASPKDHAARWMVPPLLPAIAAFGGAIPQLSGFGAVGAFLSAAALAALAIASWQPTDPSSSNTRSQRLAFGALALLLALFAFALGRRLGGVRSLAMIYTGALSVVLALLFQLPNRQPADTAGPGDAPPARSALVFGAVIISSVVIGVTLMGGFLVLLG